MIQRPVNLWSWLSLEVKGRNAQSAAGEGGTAVFFWIGVPLPGSGCPPPWVRGKAHKGICLWSSVGLGCIVWDTMPGLAGAKPPDQTPGWAAHWPIGTCLGTRALISHPPAGPSAWGIRNTACLVSRGVQPSVQGSNLSQAFCYNPRIHFLSFLHMHETRKYTTWGTQKIARWLRNDFQNNRSWGFDYKNFLSLVEHLHNVNFQNDLLIVLSQHAAIFSVKN